jgi:hypothetical protein
MISTPTLLGNNNFTLINTDESNLGLDQTRQYYFWISDDCRAVDPQTRICNRNIHFYQAMNKNREQSNCCNVEEKFQRFAIPGWYK